MDLPEIVNEFNELLDEYRILIKHLKTKKNASINQTAIHNVKKAILLFISQYAHLLDLDPHEATLLFEPIIVPVPLATTSVLPDNTTLTEPLPEAMAIMPTLWEATNAEVLEEAIESKSIHCCQIM